MKPGVSPWHPWGASSPGAEGRGIYGISQQHNPSWGRPSGVSEEEGWVLLGRGSRRCGRRWGAFLHVPREEEEEEAIPGTV